MTHAIEVFRDQALGKKQILQIRTGFHNLCRIWGAYIAFDITIKTSYLHNFISVCVDIRVCDIAVF